MTEAAVLTLDACLERNRGGSSRAQVCGPGVQHHRALSSATLPPPYHLCELPSASNNLCWNPLVFFGIHTSSTDLAHLSFFLTSWNQERTQRIAKARVLRPHSEPCIKSPILMMLGTLHSILDYHQNEDQKRSRNNTVENQPNIKNVSADSQTGFEDSWTSTELFSFSSSNRFTRVQRQRSGNKSCRRI